ncbi:hypothetical protein [Bradyrhizobium sp. sGM-13]|uniref:hypothetical protein n=1 Tax=Bradyrhizobium sp. sGM-13 TaxID=2831781 RepID=UPI001BD1B2AC|nr:hypothetical protein [Bradyrhizobium sp. sGM-13]
MTSAAAPGAFTTGALGVVASTLAVPPPATGTPFVQLLASNQLLDAAPVQVDCAAAGNDAAARQTPPKYNRELRNQEFRRGRIDN